MRIRIFANRVQCTGAVVLTLFEFLGVGGRA